jgi:hypothetical protein
MDSSITRRKRFTLMPEDAAFVVRGSGKLEVVIPETESGMNPHSHVVLTFFAIAFEDPRLHELLAQIAQEKEDARRDAPAPPNP